VQEFSLTLIYTVSIPSTIYSIYSTTLSQYIGNDSCGMCINSSYSVLESHTIAMYTFALIMQAIPPCHCNAKHLKFVVDMVVHSNSMYWDDLRWITTDCNQDKKTMALMCCQIYEHRSQQMVTLTDYHAYEAGFVQANYKYWQINCHQWRHLPSHTPAPMPVCYRCFIAIKQDNPC